MRTVEGYRYDELLRAVAERDEGRCFVRGLLIARRQAKIDEWAGGQADGLDPACREDWIPRSLLDCRGEWDAMHLLSKSWLKDEYPGGLVIPDPPEDPEAEFAIVPLFELLNDPRNCVLGCRRHHNLMDRKLVVVRGGDLPGRVWEFAGELGDRAVARLERDYGPSRPGVSAHGDI